MLAVLLLAGIYVFVRPKAAQELLSEESKQILGEQEVLEYESYQVVVGDTLFNLSQKYQISWQTLAEINSLPPPYTLRIGQKLKIPKK